MKILNWIKRCDNSSGNCVEAASDGNTILLRDRTGTIVRYTRPEWDDFVKGIREGDFDKL